MQARPLLGTLALCLLAACSATNTGSGNDEDVGNVAPGELPAGETLAEGTSYDAIFESASQEYGVPAPFLKGIAWAETRWEMIEGEEEHEGFAPAFGLMALRGDMLEAGAAAAGVSAEAVKTDPTANVRAGAAILSAMADELSIDREDLGDWASVAAEYSGAEDIQARAYYVNSEVYGAIQEGLSLEMGTLDPIEVQPKYFALDGSGTPGPDYSASVWHASPNNSARPSGTSGKVQMVIIHTCEGSYSGCWSWLASSQSGVSAHYVVNSDGSEISQLVKESRKAWHIAATYKSSLNGGKSTNLNGVSGNSFTVGIEHAGYASQSSWTNGLLNASAKLTCDITKDNGIPRDKYHIVGHGQLQPYNRVDPGANWPWTQYLGLVDSYCGGGNPPPDPAPDPGGGADPVPGGLVITVDSNNAKNTSSGSCNVSSSWTASNNVAGYYQTGYWWRKTGATTDGAEFKAKLSSAKKMLIEAYWPSASDRSTEAPFVIQNAAGDHLDTVTVNQQKNGGSWVKLGTYNLTAGWNVVTLSRWTTPGYVVVADAVRFTEVP